MSQDERLRLWLYNRDHAALMLARESDLTGQLLLVVDARDPVGGGIAKVLADQQHMDLDAHARKTLAKNEIPTLISIMPTDLIRTVIAEANPLVAEALGRSPAPGGIWVIVIAAGGTSLLQTRAMTASHAGSA